MKPESEIDFTISRVWHWTNNDSKKNESKGMPDLLLPWGSLKEDKKITLPSIGTSFRWTALLQNCDIVIGPEMVVGDADDKEAASREVKIFRSDILYLKKTMAHGTIRLDEFPRR